MTDNSEFAGNRLVDRLAKHYSAHTDVALAETLGKSKQHIHSMRQRTKADINYEIIMRLLDELEASNAK